jgi:hypothetical protein
MAKIKARNDAYTGLLAISFLALLGATVLMALDVSELGTAPQPLKIDVPGANLGKVGEGLRRPDTGKVDPGAPPTPAPTPTPAPIDPKKGMGKAEPNKLPEIPNIEIPTAPVIPVSGTTEPAPLKLPE